MSVMGVNSQRPAVQTFQTQHTGPAAQPAAAQQAQQADPLAALSKALEALEKAVQSLTTKGFNNNQSVAQQAGQNLGTSGQAQGNNNFDWNSLLGGGSTFERTQPQFTAPTPPVQQQQRPDTSFLNGTGGGGGTTHHDNGLHFGNEKSGGGSGVRIGSDGANN